MHKNITYLALIFSFIISFLVFKSTSDNFSFMRMSFAFILLIFSLPLFFKKIPINIFRENLFLIGCLFIIFSLSYLNIDFIRLLFIFIFFAFPLIISLHQENKILRNSIKIISKHLYYFFFLVSIFYVFTSDFSNRFSGFSSSSTTFSIYILSFFIMFIFTNKPKYIYVHFFLTFSLIYLSQTRSVLLILIVSFGVFLCKNYINKHLRKTSFLLIISLLLTLPIASFFSNGFSFLNRYESNERDDSTYSRLFYYGNQIDALSKTTLSDFLYGHGVDENSKVGISHNTFNNISQHNDFFVLIYDYGAIFSLVFLYIILNKVKSSFSLVMLLIYLTSFYHNMIYDYWLITLFYLSSFYNLKNKKLCYY